MQQAREQTMEPESKVFALRAVVVIGASTGGTAALSHILPKIPRDLQVPIVVVQHMRPGFTKLLARQLNGLSELPVEEAEDIQPVKPGIVVLAPSGSCLSFDRLSESPEQEFVFRTEAMNEPGEQMRSRIDHAMISAAERFGARTIGVLLSGVGDDGREGMKSIKEHGGKTLAQDESSSIIFDMPGAAISGGYVDEVHSLWNIADRIIEIVGDM